MYSRPHAHRAPPLAYPAHSQRHALRCRDVPGRLLHCRLAARELTAAEGVAYLWLRPLGDRRPDPAMRMRPDLVYRDMPHYPRYVEHFVRLFLRDIGDVYQ